MNRVKQKAAMNRWIGADGSFNYAAYKAAYRRAATAHGIDPVEGATSYQIALVKASAAYSVQKRSAAETRRLVESRIIDDDTRAALYQSIPPLDAARHYVISMRPLDSADRPTETAALLRIATHVCILVRFLIRMQDALDLLDDPDRRSIPREIRVRLFGRVGVENDAQPDALVLRY